MQASLFIDGEWRDGHGEHLTSLDPATGAAIWQGRTANASDVDVAMQAARRAFPGWAQRPLEERLALVKAYQAVVDAHQAELAEAIAREMGKPLWDAKGEAKSVSAKVDISITAYHERTGSKTSETAGLRQELRHRPLGTLAVFGPYNFPAHLPNGHIVPALIAGNTILFKPSEQTPGVGALLARYWQEAGLPAGVLNLVQGAKETGMALVAHPQLSGVLFTGSYPTGRAIHQALAGRPEVQLALEMGGNNPLIVHDAQDLDAAARLTVQSAYLTSGQRCTCARRLILVEGEESRRFLSLLQDYLPRLRVGAWDEQPEPFMGPLVNNHQAEAVLSAQSALLQAGATALHPSERLHDGRPFLSPGLIDVTAVTDRRDEEVFGPLLQVIRVADIEEAIAEANRSAYGLSAGLISDDGALWEQFSRRIHGGIVNWNRPLTGASSAAPFGGLGRSGNLRPSAYYAADYCAHPVATLAQPQVESRDAIIGLNP